MHAVLNQMTSHKVPRTDLSQANLPVAALSGGVLAAGRKTTALVSG